MIKKALLAWLLSVIVSSLWGLLTCQVLFKWVYYLESEALYRASMLKSELSWLVLAGIFNFLFVGIFVAASQRMKFYFSQLIIEIVCGRSVEAALFICSSEGATCNLQALN